MNLFDGMCTLVTGSASGLGAATAITLARGGACVIVNYRSSAREAEETADLCRSANAVVKVVQADVAIDADCRRLAAAASEWAGSMYWSTMRARPDMPRTLPISMRSRRRISSGSMP